jgi:hypothetical protein
VPSTSRVVKDPAAVSASSVHSSTYSAKAGADGSTATRWSSTSTDGQWWQADLGRTRSVDQVQVNWEAAYASKYAIETSKDAKTWTIAATQAASSARRLTTTFAARSARYVRVRSVTRATRYGVSFWEASVLGAAD